ncbi:adhesion G-protein coupled receptor F3 isoform X2 [Centroberyx affinis]|uniref:adhesion G-protein coupled receptor F3 isoform X2 n=1 Tax=Centroberyx affinis TaxID=166261 RepID=UPI003A5C577B
MQSRSLQFLVGAVFIYYPIYQISLSEQTPMDIYIAELMVESNVTLEASTILSVLNTTSELEVKDDTGNIHKVTISQSELVAECLLVGDETTCNCSEGYIWSNDVCYNTTTCCNESSCFKNVSHYTPLCIAKVKVHINGSVTLKSSTWDKSKCDQVETALKTLNGFEGMNITGQRESNHIADFEAKVSVRFETFRLQHAVTTLESSLDASVLVDTLGIIAMEAPNTSVCYLSNLTLKCTFEEATGSSGWNMSRRNERFELNNGSVVKLNNNCSTEEYKSCTEVNLSQVTGKWAGTYECGFTSGSVRHTAKTELAVALLPDEVTMTSNPLTADCSKGNTFVEVKVNATILNQTETFNVTWSYRGENEVQVDPTASGDNLIYSVKAQINCKPTTDAQYVSITFKNMRHQQKSERVDIPVIYAGKRFCSKEVLNGEEWPNTPDGDTVVNHTCEEGRVGYKSRTCEGGQWLIVYSYCVRVQLKKVLNAAEEFLGAASNMLNQTWDGVNKSLEESMSSHYLQSVEGLVKNIKVNNSERCNTENLDLQICSKPDCNTSVFDIGVSMNRTSGIFKTVAVKNLMEKLTNNFHDTDRSSLLISATLEGSTDSSVQITLNFPKNEPDREKFFCVFWDPKKNDWSDEGCTLKPSHGNRTLCQCNHLTSFSVLMSKTPVDLPFLDEITYVGLGVSICCLLLFLIIEALVWSSVVKTNLSHFRHTAMVNISLCLFLADCSFLASSFPNKLSDTWCLALTVCKHFFFLAMFGWMLSLSVMLIHQLIFVFNPLRKRVFMFFSSIIGYFIPVIIVGASYVYYKYTEKPYHNENCWLTFDGLLKGSMHAFLLPVGTVLITNLFSMAVVILTLLKSSVPDGSKADDKETAKSILKVVVFLTPVFGVTWILGFVQLSLEGKKGIMYAIVAYSFTILNSFQGLFIFLTGCFAEQKVREELFKLIMAKTPSKGKSESMRNLTATTNSKDR